MGISGLLPLLKQIQVQRHLEDFRGQTLAIDGYVWLHRGTFTCATELATGQPTSKYVEYVMQKVRLLRHHGIKPYFVFDGGPLPAKRGTEGDRKKRREENKAKGDALARAKRKKEAREFYCKAVDVTPEMAYQVIKAFRAEGVDYVVAPYEADAQLAYLERTNLVDGIITEDSDLLVFGCKRVLYKLDPASSTLMSVSRDDFGNVPAFVGWTDDQFRAMAILSGCDYLASVNGIGLKTAQKLLRKHRELGKAIRGLLLERKYVVPRGYAEDARRAELVFLHQRVFCPIQGKLVFLTPKREGVEWTPEDEAYVGEDLTVDVARAIARGDFSPITHQPIADIHPDFVPRNMRALPLEPYNATSARLDKGKGKAKAASSGSGGGILSFLVPRSPSKANVIKREPASAPTRKVVAGQASGKRSLADTMEADAAAKRAKHRHNHGHGPGSAPNSPSKSRGGSGPGSPSKSHNQNEPPPPERSLVASRFFGGGGGGAARRHSMPAPTQVVKVEVVDVDEEEVDIEVSVGAVRQEDGYVSPSPSALRFATPDLSSPTRPDSARRRAKVDADEEELSSPERGRDFFRRRRARAIADDVARSLSPTPVPTRVLVAGTPPRRRADPVPAHLRGPDLFADLDLDDIPTQDDVGLLPEPPGPDPSPAGSFTTHGSSTPGPSTPPDAAPRVVEVIDLMETDDDDADGAVGGGQDEEDILELDDDGVDVGGQDRRRAVAVGWWERFAVPRKQQQGVQRSKLGPGQTLRRRETTAVGGGGGSSRGRRKSAGAGGSVDMPGSQTQLSAFR